jgi:hypothetical protein
MKLIAQNSVLINAAMRKQTDASKIAEKWLAHDATKAASPEDVQSAKTWVKINVQMDSVALRNALKKVYGSGWAFGAADAKAEISSSVGFDWDTWEPGNEAAAVLADAPRGLRTMLDRRGVTIKGLNDTTLDRIGSSLALSLSQGLSAQETANAIDYILDDPLRSMVIARTESADAIVQANVAEYRENDITEIEWLVGDPCDICAENANVIVEIGEEFPSGDQYPPAHPNCVCDVSPKSRFDVPEEDFELSVNPDLVKYDEDQPRDERGRFGSGGGGSSTEPSASSVGNAKDLTKDTLAMGSEKDKELDAIKGKYDYKEQFEKGIKEEDKAMHEIAEMQGFTGTPTRAEDWDEFNAMQQPTITGGPFNGEPMLPDGSRLSRGFADGVDAEGNAITAQFAKSEFINGEYYAGKGSFGSGTYTTPNMQFATQYAQDKNTDNVVQFKMDPESKIGSYSSILDEMYNLSDEGKLPYSLNNAGRYAAARGFDAIAIDDDLPSTSQVMQILVLNRSAVVLSPDYSSGDVVEP